MQIKVIIAGLGVLLITSMQIAYADDYKAGVTNATAVGQETEIKQAAVLISSPAEGAIVAANRPVKISFEAIPGPEGDHVHIYVDGKLIAVLHKLSGDYEFKRLPRGKHKISVAIAAKNHQLIGVKSEINIEIR